MSTSAGKMAVLALVAWAVCVPGARGETRFVSPLGLHVAPFANWTDAATNIQSAIDVCGTGDVVLVTNGVYALGATVRVTNQVALVSLNGRDETVLDGSTLAAGQDGVFLQFGTLDGFTVRHAPRHGVKSEYGAVHNSRIELSGANGIDSFTTPRIVTNSTLVVTNTIIRKSGNIGIFTCAVDTRIKGSAISESVGAGIALQQNDTTGVIQVPRVSNFVIQTSTVFSNSNRGVSVVFANYNSALPTLPVRLEDCIVERNFTPDNGGGIYDSSSGLQIERCTIRFNRSGNSAGGVWFSNTRAPGIRNSFVENNSTPINGGGLYLQSGLAQNCVVQNNACGTHGGGVFMTGGMLLNDTIVYNEATDQGGGVWGGQVFNCIAFFNKAYNGTNVYNTVNVGYSCTAPLASGPGNISSPPGLAGYRNWRLVPSSPCIDAGSFSLASGDYDLDGDPRVWGGGVDMGCDEFYLPGLGGPLSVAVESDTDRAVVGARVAFRCDVDGAPESYVWQFSDGYSASNTPFVDRTFATPGIYTALVTASNVDDVASNSVSVEIFPGYTNYVSPTGWHVSPFTNRLEAATNIQDAIEANIPGGVVSVDDGVYDEGGRALNGGVTNRIAILIPLDVVSMNGPDGAWIVGRGPCGDNAVRCAYVATGARLIGFTLTNGHTRTSGDAERDQSGGGAWCEPGGAVEDCRILNNVANLSGGGVKNGRVWNSALRANTAVNGGGAQGAALTRCILADNAASGEGGGASGGTLENTLVASNQAEYGGGVARATLTHATVVHNQAVQSGGGVYRGVVSNSILYFNSANAGWSNYFNSICRYTCTTPDPQSTGNVTNDPRFVDAANGIFRLLRDSPAVDSAWAIDLHVDLLGLPRPLPGVPAGESAPDMGAYEYTAAHFVAPGGGHVWPFLSWADAATDLQSAIDAADPSDDVFASNGVYHAGGRVHLGALTNRVVIDKAIRVAAVNGPATTAIEGGGPVGDAAIRGVHLGANASLSGFTVRGGATRALGDAGLEQSGGGIWCEAGAVISNCAVVSNSANAFGGAVYGGRLVNSFLNGNVAAQGGGLARGEIEFCTVSENGAAEGGGVYEGTGRYSIVYFNTAAGAGPNALGGSWDACCIVPDPGGSGHILDDPDFLAPGDFRLSAGSPCIDALADSSLFPKTDLTGIPRPLDGNANGEARFDIGAQEFVHPTADTDGEGLGDADEIDIHGTDPLRQDTDGDNQSDLVEVVAGTGPMDPDSLFEILDVAVEAGRQIFSWPGRAGRLYTILATEDMAGGMTNRADYTDRPGTDGAMAFTNEPAGPVQIFGVRVRMAP